MKDEEIHNVKELLDVKTELISVSAHQLRTTLSAMKWILKMLIDKDFGPLNTEQESYIKKAFESNERMIAYVNEMLRVNHQETPTDRDESTSFDTIPLIQEVISDFVGESFKKGIEIIINPPTTLIPPVVLPKEKIRMIFQNLLENAIKYSDKGDKVSCSVSETLEDDKNFVCVKIHDQGIGIPKESQEKLFQKFFRADNAKKKETIGSGLGLYTVKKIIDEIGGKITVISEPENTTFTVLLPLK